MSERSIQASGKFLTSIVLRPLKFDLLVLFASTYFSVFLIKPDLITHSLSLGFLITVPFLIMGIVYQRLFFKSYQQTVSGDKIVFRYGVLTMKEKIIPKSKITDVSISQNFFEKNLNIFRIQINTAGSHIRRANFEEHIGGLGGLPRSGMKSEIKFEGEFIGITRPEQIKKLIERK